MRKILFTGGWMLSVLVGLAQEDAGVSAEKLLSIDSSYGNGHYRHRVEFFRRMPDRPGEIVFLGNSLTEMGEWQELIPGRPVVNRGISGDVTYGILARLDEVLSSRPAKVFLLTGTNDLKRGIPVDVIASGFERVIRRIRTESPQTKLYVQSIFPVNENMIGAPYKKITNELVKAVNEQVKELARRYGGTYIDLHPLLADEKGQLKKEWTQDGIHLWPAAYIEWVAYLEKNHYL